MKSPHLLSVLETVQRPTHLALGPLDCWIEHDAHDWRVATRRSPEVEERWQRDAASPGEQDRAALSWKRFARHEQTRQLKLAVRMPARPVVVRPVEPFLIAPGDKVQFFMSVPLSLQVNTLGDEPTELINEPVTVLSSTWFGDPQEGELCFASRTRAKRSVEELDQHRHRIICPVRMRNAAKEVLVFERFCLRVQFLSIYVSHDHFWSNEVGVTYRGPKEISRVAYNPRSPSFVKDAEEVTRAAEVDHGQFSLRSFYFGVMNL